MIKFKEIRLKENTRLEQSLAVLSLVVIALNFVICLIVVQARKDDIIKDVAKNNERLFISKEQHLTGNNKQSGYH